jgi:hypothetical protein
MKMLLNLFAAGSMFWLLAGAASAQSSALMDAIVTERGLYVIPAQKARKVPRSRSDSTAGNADSSTPPKGSTDFDPASVEADRARKAAKLSLAERERNSHIRPGSPDCAIKPVMTNAEIEACRVK